MYLQRLSLLHPRKVTGNAIADTHVLPKPPKVGFTFRVLERRDRSPDSLSCISHPRSFTENEDLL